MHNIQYNLSYTHTLTAAKITMFHLQLCSADKSPTISKNLSQILTSTSECGRQGCKKPTVGF